MGTSIRRGAVDPKIVPFLQYLSSQTQFILKGIPKELSELLDTNLTDSIVAQSQEITSTVEKIARDLKIPEGLNLQNIDTMFDQINGSIDQMTQQISPWLINSFSEISDAPLHAKQHHKPRANFRLCSAVDLHTSLTYPLDNRTHNRLSFDFFTV